MNTLFLTGGEKKTFDVLPAALKEGWQVSGETLRYEETPQRRQMRFQLSRLRDPVLQEACKKLSAASSDDEFLALAKELDLSLVHESEFAKLAFALGPEGIGAILMTVLAGAKTDDDLSLAASLAELRHELLQSLRSITA